VKKELLNLFSNQQKKEPSGGGAKLMVEEGVLQNHR
jgi:hypothetical protein